MTATLALLYRTLAAADQEGLPEPLATTVGTRHGFVYIYLASREDLDRWQQWLTRRGAGSDWSRDEAAELHGLRLSVVGEWDGWRVELACVVPSSAQLDNR